EGGGQRRVHVAAPQLTVVHPLEQAAKPRHVERVVEAFAKGLRHDRELGLAADRLEQRVGLEPLEVRGRPLAAGHARDEERADRALTEARGEERRSNERSAEQGVDFLGRDERDEPLRRGRHLAARASSPQAVAAHDSKSGASAFSAASRRRRPTASPSSHERDGCSPFQNGIVGDMPCASSTSTRSARTLTIFHAWEPSRNTSPGRLSVTNSSSSVPTFRSVSTTKTSKSPLSGIVPPDVSARNRLPRRACKRSFTRSHRIRGAAPLTSAGRGPARERP